MFEVKGVLTLPGKPGAGVEGVGGLLSVSSVAAGWWREKLFPLTVCVSSEFSWSSPRSGEAASLEAEAQVCVLVCH